FFENIVGAKDFVARRADHVAGLRCPDDLTLQISLVKPDPAFLNVLAMPFAYPIPKELVERSTDPATGDSTWAEHVVGCGPYRLEEWTRGVRLRLTRFDRYYRDDVAFLDTIQEQLYIPDFMQLMMFERGELDVSDIPLPDFQRVLADPRLKPLTVTQPENAIAYCSMNCEMPPFTNKLVRQAFNYAVDKDRICQILSGRAVPAKGVLPPAMPGYNPALRGYPHDPDNARELLARAGYPNGLSVELMTRSRPAEQRWAESIQQDLAKAGVTARLRAVAFPQWLDLSGKRRTVPFTVNAWFQDYPDPSNFLDVLLNGEKITEQNANNRAFYNNPEVNRLLDQAASMTDPEPRLAIYRQVEQMVVDDAPWIFVYHSVTWRLVQPWVRNYHLHPVWSGTEERVWLAPTIAPEKASR
ncbi:MAG: ABC transporter substrate-binding protein, partial [Armatimonadetes bacterium]|nr:ABC transporter substrate-binding protein [Armatimonadota bacterium]